MPASKTERTITVNGELPTAPRIYLNVGARPAIPDMPGIGDIDYSDQHIDHCMHTLPRHLVIIGKAISALEFAQMYRRFGAEVTQ